MTSDKRIPIVDQDVAGDSVGIRSFMPSYRHVVFAADWTGADELRSFFRKEFAIDLKEDYVTERIGRGVGCIVLAFADIDGKVRGSPRILETDSVEAVVSDVRKGRREDPEPPAGRVR
jgi:hypothetical protein